jgi:hypothetical protein
VLLRRAKWNSSSSIAQTYFHYTCGLPSDRYPDRTKRAIVLEAVKVWPGKGGACRPGRRQQFAVLAAYHKIPAIYESRDYTDAGGPCLRPCRASMSGGET